VRILEVERFLLDSARGALRNRKAVSSARRVAFLKHRFWPNAECRVPTAASVTFVHHPLI